MYNLLSNISNHVIVFIVAFLLATMVGPLLIPLLRRFKFGQTVRDDGPSSHLKKTGTPTIGGLIFLIPAIIITIYFAINGMFLKMIPMALVTIGFSLVGFIDDYLKIIKKSKDGLNSGQKMIGLILVASAFAFYIDMYTDIGSVIIFPLLNHEISFDLSWAFIPFTVFVLISTTNAVNLTDGLDGLAAGTTIIVLVFFTLVAMTESSWEHAKIFSAMFAGGTLGFLTFNLHPAKVFMGDTGSLALGGAVGALAITMKMPFIIVLIGLVYIIEALSVIIQVTSFKSRGKRVFKMAPIHHHFELSGWSETKVVRVFWLATLVLCLAGLALFKYRLF